MSTYAYAKLFLFDENKTTLRKKIDVNVNYMKNLLIGNYWVDELEGYEAKIPEAFKYDVDYEAIGWINPDKIKDMKVDDEEKSSPDIINEDDCRLFVSNFCDMYAMKEKYDFKQEADDTEALVWKKVYRKNGNYAQTWLTIGMLSDVADKFKSKMKERQQSLLEKEQLVKSLEYYKLTDSQKSNLDDDIDYLKEDIEEYETKIQCCYQMIGLIEGFKEANDKEYTDEVECCLYLC